MSLRGLHRVGPWLTLTLIAVEGGLVWTGLLGLRDAVVVALVVEALLAAAAFRGVIAGVRRFRAGRATGLGAWQAGEDGLAQLVPRPLAKFIVAEPRLWVCLVRWLTGRYPRDAARAFRYGAGLRTIFWIAIVLVAIEGAAVDVVLTLTVPGSIWVWVALGVHAYAVIGLLGFLASWITRPHLLGDRVLRLRDGIFAEVEIPYAAISGVRAVVRSNFGRSGLKIDETDGTALLAFGDANVAVAIDPEYPVHVAGGGHVQLVTLAFTADRPHEFVQALRAQVAAAPEVVASDPAP